MFRSLFWVVFLLPIYMVPAVAADSGDDFSNNLFSDLAPLLTLFGEQVANQFLSQSMGWADNIIFAMAPLGIITAIVAAIRVGGPTWLRAIIGRAKESQGSAELELMSSTSPSVCELWNGQAIVRVLGSPEIVELVYLERKTSPEPHNPPEAPEVYSFEESKSCPSEDNPLYEKERKHRSWGIGHNNNEYELTNTNPGQPFDHENLMDLEELVPSPCAPNISLNARGESASQAELWCVAILGVIVQTAVIVYDGLITLYDPWRYNFKKNGRQPAGYAFPMTAVGSVAVALGMLICSHVVEASTVEEKWKAREGDQKIKFAWLQKGQVVSDQDFDSYALFCLDDKQDIMTSRVRKNLRGFSTLVLIGTSISLVGFISQFMGLRGMHWSATIAQLIATGLMSIMRAIIRRHLTQNPRAKKLIKNFELDCMAREIAQCERFCIPSGRVERSVDIDNFYESLNIPGEGLGKELVDTRGRLKHISGWTCHFQREASALCDAIEQAMELICNPSNEFTHVQRHLDLAEFKWPLTVQTRTNCEGLADFENIVFKMTRRKPKEFGEPWGKWRINRSEVEAAYSLSMLDFHEQERKLFLSQNRDRGDRRPREDSESQNRTLRFLRFGGTDIGCAYARCLYDWWIARETECFEVKDPSDAAAENSVASFRIVGGMDKIFDWGIAVVSETPLEKLCAQHIFSIFLSSASGLITSLPGEMTVRRSNGRNVGSFGVSHTGVEKFAQILRQLCLANFEESYMSIVPPLAEKLPSILEVQPDILRFAKSRSTGIKVDEMLFWLDFTCHVTARTSIRCRKDLTSYTLAGEAYFKTAVACMSILGEKHSKTLTAVRDLLRACKIVVFMAETTESDIPEDFSDARKWYGKVLEWVEKHSGHLSMLQNELFQTGFLKLIGLHRNRFGGWAQVEDSTRYAISQSFLIESPTVTRWNEEQEYLHETWTKLKEEDTAASHDRASLSDAISSALNHGYDTVSEVLLQNMSDALALAVQMEYGTQASAVLSGADKCHNCEQAIIREFTMRCASRTFNVNSEDESGVTALCQAVISGERHLVETLLDSHGANINKEDKKKRSPIFMAATLGHHEIFYLLLERGARWGGHHESGNTCQHVAASNGFEDILEALLDPANQGTVDPTNNFGETPLHFAARSGNLFSIHHLHRMGADVNKMTQYGHTPLAYAAACGNLAVVQALKEKGANLDAVDSSGGSILYIATNYRHFHIVTELLRLGASPQWACVQEASKSGNDDIVEVLLEHLLCKGKTNVIPLMDIPQRKLLKILRFKELSASVEPMKNSLLRIAVKRRANIDRISPLLDLKADPLSVDENNNSALSLGAAGGDYDLFTLLMSPQVQQAFMEMEPKLQEVPLRVAVESGNVQIVELLLKTSSILVNDGQFSHLLPLSITLRHTPISKLLHSHRLHMDDDTIRSLLRTAVSEGSEEILNLLDIVGARIKDEAEKEFSLHLAARLGKENIISTLLSFGVKVDSHAQNGWTALQIAVQAGHLDIVKLLIDAGAQIHKKNIYQWSAVSLARARGFADILDFLNSVPSDNIPNLDDHTAATSPRPELEDDDPWANIFELDTGPIVVENQEAELTFQLAPAIDEFPLLSFELPIASMDKEENLGIDPEGGPGSIADETRANMAADEAQAPLGPREETVENSIALRLSSVLPASDPYSISPL